MELSIDTQCILHKVNKSYRYIGSEYLAAEKDFDKAKARMLFAFPDKYEIAVSNLGQKILYNIVNEDIRFMADRVYAPDKDYALQLERNNILLSSLESKRHVKDFDIVGFSLQYELAYPSVLEMLRMSGIPLKRDERSEDMPVIAAGGPCCYNPAPLSDFIDIFMIGDGEEVTIELLERYTECKAKGLPRKDIISELAKIEGIYSPLINNRVKKRIYDISKDKKIVKAPVPYSSSVQDRTVIEIRRGCGRMCRFCQAGHINLPVRERNAEDIIEAVKKSTQITGYNEYSLLSLSSNDYTNIESVIEKLSETMNKKKISVSLPSQRIDRYSQKLASLVRGVRSTTVTLAPEAGSQRLRNVINKNLSEQQIIDTILNCYKNGVSSIKLYFMTGLPTETYEDLDEMAELFRKIRYKSKQIKIDNNLRDSLNLTCTLSIFVPKPFTPFQWCAQDSQQVVGEKIKYLLEKVKPIKGVKINYHNSFSSKLECALSRADSRFNKFFLALNKKGVYLSSWNENLDKELWETTALECGIDLDKEAARKYDTDEVLPWDIVDAGINKDWLKEQYNNAMSAVNIAPCEFNCVNCGVCTNLKTHKVTDKPFNYTPSATEQTESLQRPSFRYRLKLTKENEMRYISHLDWQNTFIRTLYRSGLDLCFSCGFNPTPKFSLGIALPLFVESRCELIDFEIYNDLQSEDLCKILNNVLPKGIRVLSAVKTDKKEPAVEISAQWALYSFESLKKGILKNKELLYIKECISSSNEIFIEKINKKGIKKLVNVKPSIKSAEVEGDTLFMVLKTGHSDLIPAVKPEDIIKLYAPDTEFRIVRLRFYDKDLNEI